MSQVKSAGGRHAPTTPSWGGLHVLGIPVGRSSLCFCVFLPTLQLPLGHSEFPTWVTDRLLKECVHLPPTPVLCFVSLRTEVSIQGGGCLHGIFIYRNRYPLFSFTSHCPPPWPLPSSCSLPISPDFWFPVRGISLIPLLCFLLPVRSLSLVSWFPFWFCDSNPHTCVILNAGFVYERRQAVSISCAWLILLKIMISHSIWFPANVTISFFFLAAQNSIVPSKKDDLRF